MRLVSEGRWSRTFGHPDGKQFRTYSRFYDGSASISLDELVNTWGDWPKEERAEFCQNCSWLGEQDDFPDILRHIARNASTNEMSAVAMTLSRALPPNEAFEVLALALSSAPPEETANLAQAISNISHPDGISVLRRHLDALLCSPGFSDPDPFQNWIAFAAICTVQGLLLLGLPAEEVESEVRTLATHACAGTRRTSRQYLGRAFRQSLFESEQE